MTSHDTLIAASEVQRRAFAKALDSLRARHNQAVADLTKMRVPPSPELFDTHGEKAWLLEAHVDYMRAVWAAVKPVFERCADDARDHCGARIETVDLMDATLADIAAGFTNAAEEQLEAAAELRALSGERRG